MNIFPKFIIEGDSLILSKVTYHKELVTDKEKVKGGGWFRYDKENDTFIFYGTSEDFGQASIEDIKKCVLGNHVYRNRSQKFSISEAHNFSYYTGSEIIELRKTPL
jgi:hypothetical protein